LERDSNAPWRRVSAKRQELGVQLVMTRYWEALFSRLTLRNVLVISASLRLKKKAQPWSEAPDRLQ